MKILNFILVVVATLAILSSCKKEEISVDPGLPVGTIDSVGILDPGNHDCIFEQNDDGLDGLIDATERALMDECSENAFTSKGEIEDNLIGEWELAGHGGWCGVSSQPCAYITITADELTFEYKDAVTDTITTYSWELEERNWNGRTLFSLNTLPEVEEKIFMTNFCSNYMYIDLTSIDGNMYLYGKVK